METPDRTESRYNDHPRLVRSANMYAPNSLGFINKCKGSKKFYTMQIIWIKNAFFRQKNAI